MQFVLLSECLWETLRLQSFVLIPPSPTPPCPLWLMKTLTFQFPPEFPFFLVHAPSSHFILLRPYIFFTHLKPDVHPSVHFQWIECKWAEVGWKMKALPEPPPPPHKPWRWPLSPPLCGLSGGGKVLITLHLGNIPCKLHVPIQLESKHCGSRTSSGSMT